MTDDETPKSDQPSDPWAQQQPGAVMAPPPPPPPVTGTGAQPPRPGEQPPRRGGIVGGLVLMTIGLILLAQQFFPGFGIERFWPVILIVIGLGIIFRRR